MYVLLVLACMVEQPDRCSTITPSVGPIPTPFGVVSVSPSLGEEQCYGLLENQVKFIADTNPSITIEMAECIKVSDLEEEEFDG